MRTAILVHAGFAVYFSYSTMAPFFPSELDQRGLSRFWNSIVFSIFALSFMICALLTKKLFIPHCGRVVTFTIAAAL